jgi:hypothetical protein
MNMAKDDLQGTFDLLVLTILAQTRYTWIRDGAPHPARLRGTFARGGSLYPALHRMGRVGGCVTAAHTVTNRKPKFYKLTPQGRHQLQRAEESFDQLVKGVRNSLRYA